MRAVLALALLLLAAPAWAETLTGPLTIQSTGPHVVGTPEPGQLGALGSHAWLYTGTFLSPALDYTSVPNGAAIGIGNFMYLRPPVGSGSTTYDIGGPSLWGFYNNPTAVLNGNRFGAWQGFLADSPTIIWNGSTLDYIVSRYAESVRVERQCVGPVDSECYYVANLADWVVGRTWLQGRVEIIGQPSAIGGQPYPATLDVRAAPGQTVPVLRVLNASGQPVFCVNPDGTQGC